MGLYSTNNANAGAQQAMAAAYKTLASLTAATATLTSAKVYDVLLGTDGTPADNALDFDISRITTLGTGTNSPPNGLDPTSRAAGTVGTVNYTVEPTVTAGSSLFFVGVNQRASYRWVAAPGSELIIPNVNVNGLALRAKSPAYVGTATGALWHSE